MQPRTDGVVTLRAPREGDAALLIAGRDAEFHRFMGEGSPEPRPRAVIEVGAEVIGWVDYDRDEIRSWLAPDECNVGYHVFAPHRGRGLASRAVRLLLDLVAEEGRFRFATFLIDADNEASLRVARAVGAVERRVFPDAVPEPGGGPSRPQVLLAVELV
jgi:RimJ/RimL family protein N-acetyltransferase